MTKSEMIYMQFPTLTISVKDGVHEIVSEILTQGHRPANRSTHSTEARQLLLGV